MFRRFLWASRMDGIFLRMERELRSRRRKSTIPALSTNVEIFTLRLFDDLGNANTEAQPVKISTSPGGDFTPRYSPDGKWIAWRMQKRAGYESDRFRLVVYDRETKTDREVLPNFDRWVDEEAWGPDSKTIYFAAGDVGQEPVYRGFDSERPPHPRNRPRRILGTSRCCRTEQH